MWYTFALFIHILGSIGLFVAVVLIVISFVRMRQSSTLEQVREWASMANLAGKSMIFISLVILIPALYMVILAWGFTTPWVMAALITFVVLAIMGATMNGKTIERVFAMVQTASPGPVPDELRTQLVSPQLWLMESVRLMLLVGILVLMTMKPDMLFSVLILGSMLILGVIVGTIAQRSPGGASYEQGIVQSHLSSGICKQSMERSSSMKIAVFGATGRTGRHVLEQGISRGYQITAFTRRPQELIDIQRLQAVVHGDGRDLSDVQEAVRGQDCIITILSSPGLGPGTTVSEITKNIIIAMGEAGVRRLICVSSHSLVATRPWLVVKLVKWIFRNPYADLATMEQEIVASHLDWTIVRATQLIDGPVTEKVIIEQDGRDFITGSYQIRRSDLATILLKIAEQEFTVQTAVEVTGMKGP